MTEQELLDAIASARQGNDGDTEAMTTREIAEATGLTDKTVRRNLKKLISSGKVVPVWVTRDTITTVLDGRKQRVPGYRATTS